MMYNENIVYAAVLASPYAYVSTGSSMHVLLSILHLSRREGHCEAHCSSKQHMLVCQ